MSKFKLIVVLILAVLGIVVILQNVQSVTTTLLFVKVAMPLAVLILIMMLAGFAIGVLVSLILLHRGKLPKKQ
jgi:uncharacterized integral membrane protein